VLAVSGGAVLRYDPASGALSRKSVEGWHSPHGMRLGDEGRSVYFVPGRTATTIWRGDLQTGAAQPVLDGLLAGHWGSWSLCGRAIYYLGPNALDGDRPWVMRRALEPNAPAQPLTAWTGPLPPIGTSLWSSDPRSCHLYVERIDRGNTDVVLLENQP
jgi:hypothetical protein